MPAIEAIGLTLRILSVAGLFSTTLDAIDWFIAARSYSEDYQLLITKVNIERLRLFRWGQAVGLARGASQQHELLQDPDVRGAVCELLAWAICFFGDAESVKRRYGVEGGGRLIAFLLGRDRALVLRNSRTPAANNLYLRDIAGNMQKHASMFNKFRWAFLGKRKSDRLLQELTWFIDKLHELVPIPAADRVGAVTEITEFVPKSLVPPILDPPPTQRSVSRRIRAGDAKLVSGIRQARKNHIRRIVAEAAADIEPRAAKVDKQVAKIRVDERYTVIFLIPSLS
jgi:hypothetical protein